LTLSLDDIKHPRLSTCTKCYSSIIYCALSHYWTNWTAICHNTLFGAPV